jgi:hypothetical protein
MLDSLMQFVHLLILIRPLRPLLKPTTHNSRNPKLTTLVVPVSRTLVVNCEQFLFAVTRTI